MGNSSDIPIATSLRGGIRVSPILNPFVLKILFAYSIRLRIVIPWSPRAIQKSKQRASSLYTYLLEGAGNAV